MYDTRIAAIVTLGNIIVDRQSHKMFKRNKTAVLVKDMFQEIEVRKPIEHIYHTFDIEEKQSVTKINGGNNHRHHAKRSWVVETTNSWHNRFRRLLVRYEEKLGSYFALVGVCLGCCIVIYRRINFGIFSKYPMLK